MNIQSRAAGQHITILHVTSATMLVRHGTTYVQVPCLASYQISATGRNQ